jgi:tetratricopeptide (TPR) repeat protein
VATLEELIATGEWLERTERYDEAIAHFQQVVEQFPNDSRAHFEYGGAFDCAGREAEAIPHYYRAMEMGLAGNDLPRLYVQLGSSLRNVGKIEEAIQLLNEGCQRFPDQPALQMFRAFALYSAGRHAESAVDLMELAIAHIQTADMQTYQRAIRLYTDEIKNQVGVNLPRSNGLTIQ